jgi:hypothetical protein
MRSIATFVPQTPTTPPSFARVYRDSEWDEYQVRLMVDGQASSTYHTDDRDDAFATAEAMLDRANPNLA